MKAESSRRYVAALAGSAFVATIGVAGVAAAKGEVFVADHLDGGYLLAAKGEAEGKCGEGKCGAASDTKSDVEGKCGEGKCGAAGDTKSATEGKCGAASDTKSDAEGKCGEGKCGSTA